MRLTVPVGFFLLLSCHLWEAEAQNSTSIAVTNGGKYGKWGEKKFCPKGQVKGFSLKVQPKQGTFTDDTSLNGIRLICTDGAIITSSVGKKGGWSDAQICPSGLLTSFSLRVSESKTFGDDTGANNIKFNCTDGSQLEGSGHDWGQYGSWSESCGENAICGIETKVEDDALLDNTGLNDVKFSCCA